jgi:hypothetical protein
MQRIAIGAVAGLAVWFGSTLAAEAQSPTIQPTGPLAILTGSTTATYTATITLDVLQDFGVQLSCYRGNNPTPFNTIEQWTYGPTSLTNYFSFAAHWSPGAITGEKFKFKAKLLTTNPVGTINATDWIVTVTRPTTKVDLSEAAPALVFEAIERDRRHEA